MVGQPAHGLYVAFSGKLVCTQSGVAAAPECRQLRQLSRLRLSFTSTRVTEGFADSFAPKSDPQNLNADTGTRICVQYSGFPAGARLFVPTVVAGSDATQPTAGGDLGLTASGGKYTPGSPSSLAAFVRPEHRCQRRGRNSGLFARPSRLGYGEPGFDERSDAHQRLGRSGL